MAKISMGLGGPDPQLQSGPKPQQEWRQPQPQYQREPGIDWTQQQYATPHTSRTQHFGRRRQRDMADVPQLKERTMCVRAKGPGTYYTLEGTPIPGDEWVVLPISPGIIQAIKDGILEKQGAPGATEPQRRPRAYPPAAE